MIINNSKGFVKLIADEGKKITNSERSFFSDFIYLGKNDSADNYEEVGRDIWKYFIEEENPDVVELKEQVKDLKNIDDVTMMALAEVDGNTNANIDIILNAINELYLMIENLQSLKGGEQYGTIVCCNDSTWFNQRSYFRRTITKSSC